MSDVYILGVDMIKFGRFPDKTVPQLGAQAALLALDDAGLKIQDMEALYAGNLIGPWRWIYIGTAMVAMYLSVFVAVVQSFLKIGRLHALAPTGSEPPFVIAQGVVLLLFVAMGVVALMRFRPPTA